MSRDEREQGDVRQDSAEDEADGHGLSFRRFVENARDMLYRMSLPDGRYEYVSPSSLDIIGYAPEVFVDAPLLIRDAIHPDWRDYFAEQWGRLLAGDMPPTYEYQITHGVTGEVRWLNQRNVLIRGEDGAPCAIEGIVSDVTAVRQAEAAMRLSERRWRSLTENSNDIVQVLDANGTILYQNRVYPPHELGDVIGKSLYSFLGPEAGGRARRAVAAVKRGEGMQAVELTVELTQIGDRIVESKFVPVAEGEGQDTLIVVTRDITDKVQSARERLALEEQLRQSQKMEAVGQLAGGVAHDFNNILQVILGYGELAKADILEHTPAGNALDNVLGAGRRAKELVGQLLAFSRRQVLEMDDIDLVETVRSSTQMLGRLIGEHVRLSFDAERRALTVRADAGQIGQILTNLCLNARDAMGEGGELQIGVHRARLDAQFCRTRAWARPGRYALLSVSDDGCGMDAEVLSQIFEPFFTTKDVGEGTGLGLSTVYGLVKQHEGLIDVRSTPGMGTTFEVYFPLVPPAPPVRVVSSGTGEVRGGSETILLVEDEPGVLRLAHDVLRGAGYEVLTARDGVEALRVFAEHGERIDIAVLDVVMPVLGGRAVYERIHALRPELPVLFASGYATDALHTNFLVEQGLALLPKPFDRTELLQAVRDQLDSP